MLNKMLEKEFQQGLRERVYYFYSNDPFLLEQALTRAINTVVSDTHIDFNYDIFYPSSNIEEIVDGILTVPFMAKRRLVVIKDFEQFPESKRNSLLTHLENPPDTTCIVILSQEPMKTGSRIRCKAYNLNVGEAEMPLFVKELALQKGIRLDNNAIRLLLEFTGYDTGLLSMEIDKLTHLGKKTISEEDIMDSIIMMRQFTPFELINSLLEGKRADVFRMLRAMFDGGNAENIATPLLGALNWQFKEFYNLWLQRDKRSKWMNNRRYRAFIEYLPSYNERRFYHIFKALHNADVMIKTGGKPELVMTVLFINLLEKVN